MGRSEPVQLVFAVCGVARTLEAGESVEAAGQLGRAELALARFPAGVLPHGIEPGDRLEVSIVHLRRARCGEEEGI